MEVSGEEGLAGGGFAAFALALLLIIRDHMKHSRESSQKQTELLVEIRDGVKEMRSHMRRDGRYQLPIRAPLDDDSGDARH